MSTTGPGIWHLIDGGFARGNARVTENLGDGGYDLEVAGDWVANHPTIAEARDAAEALLTDSIAIEGALDPALLGERDQARGYPFMLGILHDSAIKAPAELEAGYPAWFAAPRFAKAAGAGFLERHPDAAGYDVIKVDPRNAGHYRTVHTYWKEQA